MNSPKKPAEPILRYSPSEFNVFGAVFRQTAGIVFNHIKFLRLGACRGNNNALEKAQWMGGRVVEGTGLENQQG